MAHRVCLAHENRILWNIYPYAQHTEPISSRILFLVAVHEQIGHVVKSWFPSRAIFSPKEYDLQVQFIP